MKKIYTTLFAVLFGVLYNIQFTKAQTFTEQAGISFTGVCYSSVAWGDYDNDGDLDLLIPGYDAAGIGICKVYRNNGDGAFTEQTSIVLTGIVGHIAWGDYNNDGYLDILISGTTKTDCLVKVFINNGNSTFAEQTSITLSGICATSIDWGDYDNDGLLDFLITGQGNFKGGAFKIYHNNGDNTFTEKKSLLLQTLNDIASWVDYDNDGYLDFMLAGNDGTYDSMIGIYHNNGDGTFTIQPAISLKGFDINKFTFGDYDNDGYPDLLLNGNIGSNGVTKLYHNNANGTFTEQTSVSLIGLSYGSVAWGDYDNDGYLDILLTGSIKPSYRATKIYHNNGNGTFTELTGNSYPNVEGDAIWGDFDNDGDLDFAIIGSNGVNNLFKIYRNNTISGIPKTVNVAAAAPTNLHIINNQDGNITFAWDKTTDTETPQNGLSYNLYIYENGQGNYLRSPQAFNQSSVKNGQRLVVKMGDIRYNAAGYTLKNLPSGNYKWSVQAIDGGFKGGLFATELSFNVLNLLKVGVNIEASQITNTSADLEYSVNSADGLAGDWAICSSQFTNFDFGIGGFNVWVREHALPSNNRKVATIAAQITPSFTIDYISEKTTQIIADSAEYAVNADMSGATIGAGIKLSLTLGQNLYFRIKASLSSVISTIQTLTVPPRTTPAYTIDFANVITSTVVPATDEVSTYDNMYSAKNGTGINMAVTPGQNLYFRSKVSSTSFKSLIQTLVVPTRPAAKNYTVDFVNETTIENVATTDEYSATSNMSSATAGTGVKVTIVPGQNIYAPGQNIYFRVKATSTDFASLAQTVTVSMRPTAPVLPIVNNITNTFDWTNNSNFTNATDYEYSTDNGVIWTTCTVKPITIGNIEVAMAATQIRVKAIAATQFCSLALKSNAAFTINTGIVDFNSLGIKVYPNPVNHILILENVPANIEASIWSIDGKLLKKLHLENKNNEIDVNNLPNGLYILKIQNNKVNAETRFVKL